MATKIELVKKIMKPLRFFWIGLAVFLILTIISYFVLKIPSVQKYISDQTTSILSEKFKTKVEISEVNINIFKGIKIKDLYIEDTNQDTLIYVEAFYSDFYNSLRSFYGKSFLVKDLELSNGKVFFRRSAEDPVYNYVRLLNPSYDPFAIDSTQHTAKNNDGVKADPFTLDVDKITLKNISYVNQDDAFGNTQTAQIDFLKATVDSVDVHKLNFVLDQVSINGTSFKQERFKPSVDIKFPAPIYEKPPTEFRFFVKNLDAKNLHCSIIDRKYRPNVTYDPSEFTPQFILVNDLTINAENVEFTNPYYVTGKLNNLEASLGDFKIEEFSADRFFLDKRKSGFENISLKTPSSTLQDDIIFKYRKIQDWRDFVNKVILDGNLNKTIVAVEDLMFFAPTLKKNRFFVENRKESIILDGKFSGRINSFNARNFNAEITNNLNFKGSIIARDITSPDETLLNIGIKELNTDLTTLEKLIPGFQLPSNFYKLKTLSFAGRFDGYYQDFVAYGDLLTELGRADVDMRLNLKEGSKKAQYSGKLNLYDFDLQSWTEMDDFGKLSFSANVENGRGLDLRNAYAELGGELISFNYKGYNYKGLVDAKLERNLFDGKFSTRQKELDFDFEGNIDFKSQTPLYDFRADIRTLDLQKLNFSKDINHIEGKIDIKAKGSSIDDLIGSALGNQIVIHKGTDTLDFGHLALASNLETNGNRNIYVDSDMGNAEIIGEYKLTELPDAVIGLLKKNYPDFTKDIKYIAGEPQQNVKAKIKGFFNDPGDLISFFIPQDVVLDSLNILGDIDYSKNIFNLELNSPTAQYESYAVDQLYLNFDLGESLGKFTFNSKEANISGNPINDLEGFGILSNDSIHFNITAKEVLDSIENIKLAGEIFPGNNEVKVEFKDLAFDFLASRWNISKNNYVEVGEEKLKLKNFTIQDDNRRIALRSINENKGVEAKIADVQLSLLNQFINSDDFALSGNTNATISYENIFRQSGLFINAEVERVRVKDQLMGLLKIDATTDFERDKIEYVASLANDEDKVVLKGNFGTKSKIVNAQLDIDGFPLNFLENFLEGDIENTQGLIYAQIDVEGKFNDLDTRGRGQLIDGYTEVNYLGTRYTFEEANFKLRKNFVDFTNAKLIDSKGQPATITGGLTHKNFNNLGLDLQITSDNFILINTSSEDNDSYYGFGQGKADVSFKGEFSNLLISINATTGEETTMTLPISYSNSARDESFLPIISRAEYVKELEAEKAETKKDNYYVGLTLEMVLEVTPEAEMIVLFDPVTGHQLKGRGEGDIQLFLTPNGEINMYGGYNIAGGSYDFVLENLIKKTFSIQEGGTIIWSGDPVNAQINIAADYKTIRAPLNVFLAEYLGENDELQTRASQETDVLLTVNLLDQLLNPTIQFDIEFPNLTAELSSIVTNKLEILKDDPLLLNNQVLGLLIFNNFLAYNNPIAGLSNSSVNSSVGVIFGEFISSQFSEYVSSLMETILDENNLIYDVDVDFRLDLGSNINNTSSTNSNAYGVSVKPKFSDKFDVILEGDYLTRTSVGSYTTGDFIFDYYLEDDKKLKIRVYGRTDIDVIDGRRQRVGTGIYFRREFASFKELKESLTKVAKKIKAEK